jgi:hypothetical protein
VFPIGPNRKRRSIIPLIALGFLCSLGVLYQWRMSHQPPLKYGSVQRLRVNRDSADAHGREDDWVLRTDGGTSITVVATPALNGHRPLVGAIVDVATVPGDVPDPLIYLRPTFAGGSRDGADLTMAPPQAAACSDGRAGLRTVGLLGLTYSQHICAVAEGRFEISTEAAGDEGSAIADELNIGSLPVVISRVGSLWDEQADTSFIAVAQGGTAVLLESSGMHLRRSFSHFGQEVFPSPVLVRYRGDTTATRTLGVFAGDPLTAVSHAKESSRRFEVTFGANRAGSVAILAEDGREMATGQVERGKTRRFTLPPTFGAALLLTDDQGVVTDARVPLDFAAAQTPLKASPSAAGTLLLDYRDGANVNLPVHVLFKGMGVPDPRPVALEGRAAPAGRSLYLFDGKTRVSLAPGKYRVTASHGISWSLSEKEVTIEVGGSLALGDVLRQVVDTTGYVAGDFHLHSAPSPDSVVLLDQRVMSLVSEGIEIAVATDHNHVTDFAPHVHGLGAEPLLDTMRGVEITSASDRWGHFNAYPLPSSTATPAQQIPVYHGKKPADMFASARSHGAKIVQVNHGRMAPAIGYFDLAHLDAKTGRADPVFAGNFEAFEAYNGMWIESYDKVREGAVDLVALARWGTRIAAMGNSDSHKLLFEEAGYPRTFVHTPREPRANLLDRVVQTILAGDTTVSSGPFVELTVEGKPPGTLFKPEHDVVKAHIRVSAPAWASVDVVEIWRDDAVEKSFTVLGPPKDGLRFEADLELPVGESDVVFLAWAEGKKPLPDVVPYEHALSIGFSGLVYVDTDGNGRIKVPARK